MYLKVFEWYDSKYEIWSSFKFILSKRKSGFFNSQFGIRIPIIIGTEFVNLLHGSIIYSGFEHYGA